MSVVKELRTMMKEKDSSGLSYDMDTVISSIEDFLKFYEKQSQELEKLEVILDEHPELKKYKSLYYRATGFGDKMEKAFHILKEKLKKEYEG